MELTITQDKAVVTRQTVVWSVKLIHEPTQHLAMGVGWDAFIAAIKDMRCRASEDHGDVIMATWTGSGGVVHTWAWHATNDAPALLPPPEGLDIPATV